MQNRRNCPRSQSQQLVVTSPLATLLHENFPRYSVEKGQTLRCQQYRRLGLPNSPKEVATCHGCHFCPQTRAPHTAASVGLPVPVKAAFRGGAFRTGPGRGGIGRRGPGTSSLTAMRRTSCRLPPCRSAARRADSPVLFGQGGWPPQERHRVCKSGCSLAPRRSMRTFMILHMRPFCLLNPQPGKRKQALPPSGDENPLTCTEFVYALDSPHLDRRRWC